VAEPRPTALPYAAKDFVADIQKKVGARVSGEKAQAVKWEVLPADGTLNIDPELTEWAAAELFRNAFRHDLADGAVQAQASVEGDWFTLSIREAKKEEIDPAQWDATIAGDVARSLWSRITSGTKNHRGAGRRVDGKI